MVYLCFLPKSVTSSITSVRLFVLLARNTAHQQADTAELRRLKIFAIILFTPAIKF
jgi:hypothetical protein